MRNNAAKRAANPFIHLAATFLRRFRVKSSGEIGGPGVYIKIREIEKRIICTIVSLLPMLFRRGGVF